MPGYGYASAPKSKIAAWTDLIHRYLQGRANLGRVYVLIDSRHGLKDVDLDVLKTFDAAVSYQIVLTKADQVKTAELDQRIAETTAALAASGGVSRCLATSSKTGAGMPELRAAMMRCRERAVSALPHPDALPSWAPTASCWRRPRAWPMHRGCCRLVDAAVSRHAAGTCAGRARHVHAGSDRDRFGFVIAAACSPAT